MVSFPPCKINLGLQIHSRRSDGYHNIATCFYPLPWTDILEILPYDSLEFTQTGNNIPGKSEDNLCLKAYHLLKQDFELPPAQIHLHKIIPTGAGLGGGSSDGAHTLRLLNAVFAISLSEREIMRYASQLGSDCAFFVQDNPMIGQGRGEILEPVSLSLKGYYIRLFKSEIHISTAEAYAGVNAQPANQSIRMITEMPITLWKNELKNDFEMSVFKKYPSIEKTKNDLYAAGAVYASMSGSGSAVYGIFDNDRQLEGFSMKENWSGWL